MAQWGKVSRKQNLKIKKMRLREVEGGEGASPGAKEAQEQLGSPHSADRGTQCMSRGRIVYSPVRVVN